MSEKKEYAVPRFCPDGCGETVIASQLTDTEWEEMYKQNKNFIREASWIIKCSKCGLQNMIGGLN